MKSKKHILLLVPGFPENNNDSTCIPPLQLLVQELQEQYGNELLLQVIAFQYPFQRGSYSWNGIPVYSAGGKNSGFPWRIITWLRILLKISSLHKKQPVDVVHSFWLNECAFIGQWVSRLTGAKHIAHVMGQDVLSSNKYIRYLNTDSMLVIANSNFSALTLEKNFGIKPGAVIPFGIRESDFISNDKNLTREIHLLNVGSLISLKNQELFIMLFAELVKHFPGLKGAIIGDGPLAGRLREQILLLKLEGNIKMEGALPRNEVLKRMTQAKILLHTSVFESAGYVFLEALHSGMKVVSFKTGFLPVVDSAFSCETEEEMFVQLKKLLSMNLSFNQQNVPLMRETAEKIFDLYMQ